MRIFTLEFEKPILELEQTLNELQKQAEEQKIDLTAQIKAIEDKLEATKKEIFTNLTPWQRVQLARHPNRPYMLDYIERIATEFIELHGDRRFADDHAIIGGLATIDEHRVMDTLPRREVGEDFLLRRLEFVLDGFDLRGQ